MSGPRLIDSEFLSQLVIFLGPRRWNGWGRREALAFGQMAGQDASFSVSVFFSLFSLSGGSSSGLFRKGPHPRGCGLAALRDASISMGTEWDLFAYGRSLGESVSPFTRGSKKDTRSFSSSREAWTPEGIGLESLFGRHACVKGARRRASQFGTSFGRDLRRA